MLDGLKYEMDAYLPLRDVVFKTIRRAILKGDLSPGERLMEITLAKQLGVSRTPIREAIRKLEIEGLVAMTPRKGAVVAGITGKSLRDVLEVRKALEELAIELACQRMDDEAIEELATAEAGFRKAVESDNAMDMAQTDELFHDIIFKGTKNDRLIQLLNHLREQMYRYRLEYVKDKDKRKLLIKEHEEILELIRLRDVERAKALIREHIDNQEITVLKNIKEN